MTGMVASQLAELAICFAAFAIGGWLALLPTRQTRKIEKRVAAGDDRFFEEQRAYRSYPRLRNPKTVRYQGIMLMIGASLFGALRYFQPS